MVEPKIKEVRVHWGGEGKVALRPFGKESSGYGANISRTYEIPSNWTDDQVAVFEREIIESIKENLEPVLQAEHNWRIDAQQLEG